MAGAMERIYAEWPKAKRSTRISRSVLVSVDPYRRWCLKVLRVKYHGKKIGPSGRSVF